MRCRGWVGVGVGVEDDIDTTTQTSRAQTRGTLHVGSQTHGFLSRERMRDRHGQNIKPLVMFFF